MSFEWTVIRSHWDALLLGFGMSLAITLVALAMGVVLGLVLCAARLSGRRAFATPARGYIPFFRITPEIMMIPVMAIGIARSERAAGRSRSTTHATSPTRTT